MTYAGKCFPCSKAFNSEYEARYFFDDIDLRTIFEHCIEEHPALTTVATAKKFCYVGKKDEDAHIVPVKFLDRADYDYGNFAIDDLKRSELIW